MLPHLRFASFGVQRERDKYLAGIYVPDLHSSASTKYCECLLFESNRPTNPVPDKASQGLSVECVHDTIFRRAKRCSIPRPRRIPRRIGDHPSWAPSSAIETALQQAKALTYGLPDFLHCIVAPRLHGGLALARWHLPRL